MGKRKLGDRKLFFLSFLERVIKFYFCVVVRREEKWENPTFAVWEGRAGAHLGQWCTSLSYLPVWKEAKQRPGSLPSQ